MATKIRKPESKLNYFFTVTLAVDEDELNKLMQAVGKAKSGADLIEIVRLPVACD